MARKLYDEDSNEAMQGKIGRFLRLLERFLKLLGVAFIVIAGLVFYILINDDGTENTAEKTIGSSEVVNSDNEDLEENVIDESILQESIKESAESVSIEESIKEEESESISIEESIKEEESIQQVEKEAQEAEHEAKRQADPIGFEAEEVWGSNLDKVDFNADTGYIEVHAQMSDNFSTSWIVSGFESRALDFLEAIENEDFSSVSIMGYFNMVDAYGNNENMYVYDLQLSKETVNQINFDNFSQDNLSKVADFYYLHNAFQ